MVITDENMITRTIIIFSTEDKNTANEALDPPLGKDDEDLLPCG
jgi:hypothetical protein